MRTTYRRVLLSLGFCAAGSSLGCGSDTVGPTIHTTAQQYWALRLNHHAITLAMRAPYDTLTLVATPQTVTGAPLVSNAQVIYTSSDTSIIVDSTGRLTAHAPATGVTVVAREVIGGVSGLTLADTAVVNVNDTTPVPILTTFSIQPLPGDSAKRSVDEQLFQATSLVARVEDASQVAIPNVVVHYTTANSSIAEIDPGMGLITEVNVGRVMLIAEATVYGVTKTDSLWFTVGWPLDVTVYVDPYTPAGHLSPVGSFHAGDDTVGVGAIVTWNNELYDQVSDSVDVVFVDSEAVQDVSSSSFFSSAGVFSSGGGNIQKFGPADPNLYSPGQGQRSRLFPIAGTYAYHSAVFQTTGVIHVVAE